MKNVRFAGAQIPCSKILKNNVQTIKTAIDWAVDNQVDYLITPEGSLSGYIKDFDVPELVDALTEIEQYAANKVGLCLGTLWTENENDIGVRRNQIRFYSKDGILNRTVDKTIITPYDVMLGIAPSSEHIIVPFLDEQLDLHDIPLIAGAFICADFYGKKEYPDLTRMSFNDGAHIFLHATNAERDVGRMYDSVMSDWHNAHLRNISYLAGIPVISVDNSIKMDGTEWNGPTSSQSGVLIGGEWVVTVPRVGTHYFYYDFPLDKLIHMDWPNGIGKN